MNVHHEVEYLYERVPVNLKPSDHLKAAAGPIIYGLLSFAAGLIVGALLWWR
jgi:hypothetical protein